ncbi:MAG TPA: substrate binding domain-containing protein [Kofleriaceae bacterium]
MRSTVANPRGRVRVSMPSDFGQHFLTPLFVEYATRYPDIDLELDLSPRIVDLLGEGFDLAVRIGGQPDSALATRTVARVRGAVFASPAYLAQHGAPATPDDLARHSCLTLVRGDLRRQWTLHNGAKQVTVRVAGRAAANNPSMLKRLAAAGLGLALVDELVAVDDVERGALVRVLEDWRPPLVPVHAVTLTKSPPKKVRLLLDCLRDHIASVRARVEAGPRPAGSK